MSIDNSGEDNILSDSDVYYEERASIEEIYLEETEVEVHSVLESYTPTPARKEVGRAASDATEAPHAVESLDEQRDRAAEELITGDSDDPPLSEEAVSEMIQMTHPPKTSSQ